MSLAVHADWSVDPGKRWFAAAEGGNGRWRVAAPAPVGEPGAFLAALRRRAGAGAVALGVDFPLGLPRAFVARHGGAGAEDFPGFLRALDPRAPFFSVAGELAEVSPARPFFPARFRPGMGRAGLAAALGLAGPAALARACDRATAERPAGGVLFWTLGANQTGKAALAAWREMLLPALAGPDPPLLWPFAGPFRGLLAPGRVVIAETYPAEALRQIGLRLGGSKRAQAARAALAPGLRAALERRGAAPVPALAAAIADGFGADARGEDRFDCLLGLLSVLGVLAGYRPDVPPPDPWLTRWEGWVLGQTASPRAAGGVADDAETAGTAPAPQIPPPKSPPPQISLVPKPPSMFYFRS